MADNSTDVRDWTIYKITSPTGRLYVGKTCNYKSRMRSYNSVLSTRVQPLIYKSFLKHGKDNHVFDVIDSFSGTNSYCNDKEMFWIRSYMSNIHKFPEQKGLNLTDGGDGTLGYKKSDEERAAMVVRYSGRKCSDKCKETARITMTGNTYSIGRKQPKEERDRRAAKLRGGKRTPEQKEILRAAQKKLHNTPIVIFDSDANKEYLVHGLWEAEKASGVHRDNISRILRGLSKRVPVKKNRKYTFKFKS
jgi:group I intron endonuclease